MICARGHAINDGDSKTPGPVICPVCARQRNDRGLRDAQSEFLRKVIRGEFGYGLRITKAKAHADKHLIMFTTRNYTYCGRELEKAPEIGVKPYDEETLAAMCPLCRSELAGMLEGIAR